MDSSLQSPEELPPQTFKYEEHSKRNHPNYIPRSQSSLESSSKASRNLNKPQIGESFTDSSLQSPEELPPQTFKYKEHSKQNHPNYLPRSQSSLELSSKTFRNLTNHKLVMKLYEFKPPKPRRTSTTNLQRRRTHQEHEKHVKNIKNT